MTIQAYNFLDTQRGEILFNAATIAALLAAATTLQPVTLGAITSTDDLSVSKAVTVTAPATERLVYGKLSAIYAGAVTSAGNLCGVRGEFALGNAATVLGAGYFYGTQGKITAVTGATVGAGAWVSGLIGQLDLSLGVVSGDPQIAAIWGDMGATSPASGWGTGSCIFKGLNTTAAAVNSHLYTYGKATYWAEVDSNGSGIIAAAGASHAGSNTYVKADRVVAGIFDGVAGFIPIFNSNS